MWCNRNYHWSATGALVLSVTTHHMHVVCRVCIWALHLMDSIRTETRIPMQLNIPRSMLALEFPMDPCHISCILRCDSAWNHVKYVFKRECGLYWLNAEPRERFWRVSRLCTISRVELSICSFRFRVCMCESNSIELTTGQVNCNYQQIQILILGYMYVDKVFDLFPGISPAHITLCRCARSIQWLALYAL